VHRIDNGKNLVVVEIFGVANYEITIAAIKEAYDQPGYFKKNNIWIFPGEYFEVKVDQLDLVTKYILENYPEGLPRIKSALVVPPGFNMAIIEVWASNADQLPYDVKVFTTVGDAKDWIAAPVR
jgi:hypothetical protein